MKRKEKFIAGFVACILLFTVMLTNSLVDIKAASEAKLEVSTVEGYEGDTLEVTVSLTENPGLAGLEFKLRYDASVLSVVSAEETDVLVKSPVINPDAGNAETGKYIGYVFAEAKDYTGTGVILKVVFKIAEGATLGDTAVTLDGLLVSNFDGDTVASSKTDGTVTVLCKHGTTKDEVTKEAACTEAGVKSTVCTICGKELATTPIEALGHKYGEYTTTKAATCTEKGEAEAVCERCGGKVTKEIEALGHKYGEYTTTKAATCTEKGEAEAVCERCGDKVTKEIEALGHKYGEYATTKEATCTEKGEAEAVCERCGDKVTKEIEALGHKPGEFTVIKEATAEEEGVKSALCSVCNQEITEKIPVISEKPEVPAEPEEPAKPEVPATGDEAATFLYVMLMMLAAGAGFAGVKAGRNKRNNA